MRAAGPFAWRPRVRARVAQNGPRRLLSPGGRTWARQPFDTFARFRIERQYRALRAIERGCSAGGDPASLKVELDRVERRAASMFVPGRLQPQYFQLRSHVAWVHGLLVRRMASQRAEVPRTDV
jgi:hypothetical protein